MDIDTAQFRMIVRAVFESSYREGALLSADDAIAIVGIAQLAVGADRREDDEELATLEQVIGHVCSLAGIAPSAVPSSSGDLPTDDDDRLERMRGLGGQLSSKPSRELAYAVTYLLSISDLDLAPAESELIDDLAVALDIPDERSDEIAQLVASAITPPG